MNRLFLDANVLFNAAHNPNGKAALVIELGVEGHWELCSSTYALEEARRNLQRKFPESVSALAAIESDLNLSLHRAGTPRLAGLADKDQPIFQAALSCNATHILTGDLRDFGRFMNNSAKTHGIRIQTTAEFLEALTSHGDLL